MPGDEVEVLTFWQLMKLAGRGQVRVGRGAKAVDVGVDVGLVQVRRVTAGRTVR